MKKTLWGFCLLVIFAGGLAGCASLNAHRYQSTIETLVTDLNQGNAAALIKSSRVPFLLDREIILLPKDLELFWQNLVTARFIIKEPFIGRPLPVDRETLRQFADTMEGAAFFTNYISAGAYWVTVETTDFRLKLLLDKDKAGKRVLKGWKGPEPL